jgi:hypothetical protein
VGDLFPQAAGSIIETNRIYTTRIEARLTGFPVFDPSAVCSPGDPRTSASGYPGQLSNAVWQAERRGRITRAQTDEIMQAMAGLDIESYSQAWGVRLPLARQFDRSAYEAAYSTLAQETRQPLLTGDLRLYNAVHA